MKKAVVFGAGNIGRGFIGRIFSQSGYEVCYLDVVQVVVDALNQDRQYEVRLVTNEGTRSLNIQNVRAVNSTTDAAIQEIVDCDIMATSVGVNVLPKIAGTIARAALARRDANGRPLDIILCENQLGADVLMRGWVNEKLSEQDRVWTDANLGLVEASIGCMVPKMTPEMRAEHPLLICAEPYAELPVDREGFKGEIPDLVGLIPYKPFEFYIKRKLFIHNGGHAICAYLGHIKGYEYIYQAIADPEIKAAVEAAMRASGKALIAKFGEEIRPNVEGNIDDLLHRFGNVALKDTVARVGGDLARKLRRDDRIIGAALFCMEQGVDPAPILAGVKAALQFDQADDPTAPQVLSDLREKGLDYVMEHEMGLEAHEPLAEMIRKVMA